MTAFDELYGERNLETFPAVSDTCYDMCGCQLLSKLDHHESSMYV